MSPQPSRWHPPLVISHRSPWLVPRLSLTLARKATDMAGLLADPTRDDGWDTPADITASLHDIARALLRLRDVLDHAGRRLETMHAAGLTRTEPRTGPLTRGERTADRLLLARLDLGLAAEKLFAVVDHTAHLGTTTADPEEEDTL